MLSHRVLGEVLPDLVDEAGTIRHNLTRTPLSQRLDCATQLLTFQASAIGLDSSQTHSLLLKKEDISLGLSTRRIDGFFDLGFKRRHIRNKFLDGFGIFA